MGDERKMADRVRSRFARKYGNSSSQHSSAKSSIISSEAAAARAMPRLPCFAVLATSLRQIVGIADRSTRASSERALRIVSARRTFASKKRAVTFVNSESQDVRNGRAANV